MMILHKMQHPLKAARLAVTFVLLVSIGLVGCDTNEATITNDEISIYERLTILNETGTLRTLVETTPADAPLSDTFSDPNAGPFTLFAPTSTAISAGLGALDGNDNDTVVGDEITPAQLATVLEYHTLQGVTLSGDLSGSQTVSTLAGEELVIETSTVEGELQITLNNGQAQVVIALADIEASNGAVHVIDGLLIPPSLQ